MSETQELVKTLRTKIATHEAEIKKLNIAIEVILSNAPAAPVVASFAADNTTITSMQTPAAGVSWAGRSLRKAILALMAEGTLAERDTSAIARELLSRGMTTKGQRFGANVSATLSEMAKDRNEIMRGEDGGWYLTEFGARAAALLETPIPSAESTLQLQA